MANNIDVNSSASRSPRPQVARLSPLQPEGGMNANTPNTGAVPLNAVNPTLGGITSATPLADLRNAAE